MTQWSELRLHDGGPCPVGGEDEVRIVIGLPGLTAQIVDAGIKAGHFDWSSDPSLRSIGTGKINALPIIAYQVALPEPRDMQVPWHVLPPEYRWAARDEHEYEGTEMGEGYAFDMPPKTLFGRIWHGGNKPIRIDQLVGYDPGTKPWDQSLIQRPEGM